MDADNAVFRERAQMRRKSRLRKEARERGLGLLEGLSDDGRRTEEGRERIVELFDIIRSRNDTISFDAARRIIAMKNAEIDRLEQRLQVLTAAIARGQVKQDEEFPKTSLGLAPALKPGVGLTSATGRQADLFAHLIREEDEVEGGGKPATPAGRLSTHTDFPGPGSWLKKKGQTNGSSWKLRWFVLREARPGR